jgi:ABC-type antimicrobial peptide transport system permease subunit
MAKQIGVGGTVHGGRAAQFVEELRTDVRYDLRWLTRSPGFATAAILSLGLGIGANTAVFSLLDAVLLKSLPVAHPESLAVMSYVTGHPADHGEPVYQFTYRMFEALRRPGASLAGAAASARFVANVDVGGTAGPGAGAGAAATPSVQGQMVSGNYYTLLGVSAAAGRLIVPDDDRAPGANAVAVLSHAYWMRQFGGDAGVVGRVVRVNGHPFTIAGVSAPEFFGTRVGERADITVPISMQVQASPEMGASLISGDGVHQFWLEVIGRLQPGVPLTQAQAELAGVFRQPLQEFLDISGPKGQRMAKARFGLEPGSRGLSELRRRFSRPLGVVMAVVALVLLIACANLANLLLARAAARQREMALRVSLGARRGRLVRQMLTESLVLALAGGVTGLFFAWWAGSALAASLGTGVGAGAGSAAGTATGTGSVASQALGLMSSQSQLLNVAIDLRVLGFTLGVSLLTAMLFGLVPAIGASRVDPQALLRSGHQPDGSRLRAGLGRLLVAGQVAASLLLLVGAGLFVRTLINLRDIDLGVTHDTILATRVEPRGSNQKTPNYDRLLAQYDDLLVRVRALPGVGAASLASTTPLGVGETLLEGDVMAGSGAATSGPSPSPSPSAPAISGTPSRVRWAQIFPDYFATLGVPVLAGRELVPADNDRAKPRVAVINKTMATQLFGSPAAAIGRGFFRTATFPGQPTPMVDKTGAFTIVGVVGDLHDSRLREPIGAVAYSTYAHTPTGRGQLTLVVRMSGDARQAAGVMPALREQVRRTDPSMPLRDIETVAYRLHNATRQERLVAALSGAFGVLALLLACVGLYGVMAYGVARRRAEFGLRLALGASRGEVSWLVLRETLAVIALGVAIGVPLALLASRFISRMLYGLDPTDPVTITAAVVILAIVATLAGYLPARRAARIDPLVALRHE